jgi:hypothetical protein
MKNVILGSVSGRRSDHVDFGQCGCVYVCSGAALAGRRRFKSRAHTEWQYFCQDGLYAEMLGQCFPGRHR